uniref:Cardiotrophin-like cytokine factor 1 n=1 Tax=Amphilophus citrinellus TaxID=61819 RepID=A0A3Q0REM0_AMPCI
MLNLNMKNLSPLFSWRLHSSEETQAKKQNKTNKHCLTYLGPPFNEKDFSPPRPNSTALTLPSAATRVDQWHRLENKARLAQNQKAYSILLGAVRELARSTLCPSLKTSLLHFCTGLDGLLGSISALMTALGDTNPTQTPNMRTGRSFDLLLTQACLCDRQAYDLIQWRSLGHLVEEEVVLFPLEELFFFFLFLSGFIAHFTPLHSKENQAFPLYYLPFEFKCSSASYFFQPFSI